MDNEDSANNTNQFNNAGLYCLSLLSVIVTKYLRSSTFKERSLFSFMVSEVVLHG
jgi:hypothetical protein